MLASQGPVGTRGGVEWMRGPGACPGWGATLLLHEATRTSTRPPPCPTSAPCPYRTPFGCQHSLGASAKRSGARINTSCPPPIYRPGEGIDGPLADKSAVRQYIVRLRGITDVAC